MTATSPNASVMIVLAYLWPLAVVPLLVEKNDPEVQWHAKHGIVLMVAEIVVFAAFGVLTSIISLAAFGLGCVVSMFGVFLWIADPGDPCNGDRLRPQRPAFPDSRRQRVREPFLDRRESRAFV